MKKHVKVVMLPTEKASKIIRNPMGRLDYREIPINGYEGFKAQHLYFLSDDEIKKGWKGIAYKNDIKGKVFNHFYTENKWYKDAKIVIATTDESLGLPRPSNEFIKKYCELGGIDDVMVEYDCDHSQMPNKVIDLLKIAPDNTISIYSMSHYSKQYN